MFGARFLAFAAAKSAAVSLSNSGDVEFGLKCTSRDNPNPKWDAVDCFSLVNQQARLDELNACEAMTDQANQTKCLKHVQDCSPETCVNTASCLGKTDAAECIPINASCVPRQFESDPPEAQKVTSPKCFGTVRCYGPGTKARYAFHCECWDDWAGPSCYEYSPPVPPPATWAPTHNSPSECNPPVVIGDPSTWHSCGHGGNLPDGRPRWCCDCPDGTPNGCSSDLIICPGGCCDGCDGHDGLTPVGDSGGVADNSSAANVGVHVSVNVN